MFKPEEVCKARVPLFLAVLATDYCVYTDVSTFATFYSAIGDSIGAAGAGAAFTSGTLGADIHIFISLSSLLRY